jgi:hypothetical protein
MCSDYMAAHIVPLSHIHTKAKVAGFERLFDVELPG